MSLTNHLVARGVDEFTQRVRNLPPTSDVLTITRSGYAVFVATTIFFFLCSAAVCQIRQSARSILIVS